MNQRSCFFLLISLLALSFHTGCETPTDFRERDFANMSPYQFLSATDWIEITFKTVNWYSGRRSETEHVVFAEIQEVGPDYLTMVVPASGYSELKVRGRNVVSIAKLPDEDKSRISELGPSDRIPIIFRKGMAPEMFISTQGVKFESYTIGDYIILVEKLE